MSAQVAAVVSGDDSDIHDEAHIRDRRVTVRHIHARVEKRGLHPETVADRLDLPLSAVYHALAYYHDHPEEMNAAERRHEEAIQVARRESTVTQDT
jgi:uncharacterized protein (DUF433 family)